MGRVDEKIQAVSIFLPEDKAALVFIRSRLRSLQTKPAQRRLAGVNSNKPRNKDQVHYASFILGAHPKSFLEKFGFWNHYRCVLFVVKATQCFRLWSIQP